MKLEFGYGTGIQTVEVPDKNLCAVLRANERRHEHRGEEAVRYALAHPHEGLFLRGLVRPGQKIAIVASDISRPAPSYQILPPILEELFAAGCRAEDITVVFALGVHRCHTEEEKRRLVGDRVYDTVRCEDSRPEDCVRMGYTRIGTPVDVTRTVAEADFRICTGNIEYHYFAGYSGGVKAIMPGVSSHDAIQSNHKLMVREESCAGNLDTNPLRQDIEECGRICGVDYIVNVVLDEHKKIVYAVAGDAVRAHREGCRYIDSMYLKPIDRRADIVLVSQGGAPKDANLYQTQKALDNAKHAVRPGGTVILMGACGEGMGSARFQQWFEEAACSRDLIDRVHRHFELGGHKAAAIAMVLERAEIFLVSEMEDAFVRRLFMTPMPSAQEAFDLAMARHGENATVIAMPYGGSTLPRCAED